MAQDFALTFRKMNGLGNEIVVVDARGGGLDGITAAHARALAAIEATHFDQLMVLLDADPAETNARVEIFNTDGSPAEACGNGMRCVALTELDARGARQQRYETAAGDVAVLAESAERIMVDMGEPRLKWDEIPLSDPFNDTKRIELQIGPIDDPILHSPSVCSMGNPHAIFWVDDIDAYDLERMGPMLENHPRFPERANITLAQVETPQRARIRTWERGAGLTQACGTAACATLVSGVRLKLLEREAQIIVPGGPLDITWDEATNHVFMTGPAELERTGKVTFHADGSVSVS
jgi:diaminopimelate epimerase